MNEQAEPAVERKDAVITERREVIVTDGRELRAFDEAPQVNEGNRLSGYALRYMQPSHVLYEQRIGEFIETIAPNAFERWLSTNPDIYISAHHIDWFLTGRTSAGTLTVRSDESGLAFDNDLPNHFVGQYLREAIARKDIIGMSFEFVVLQDEVRSVNGMLHREVREAQLFAINPVIHPAYPQPRVNVRSLQAFQFQALNLNQIEHEPEQKQELPLSYYERIIRAYR